MYISQNKLQLLKGWYISDCMVRNPPPLQRSMRNTKGSYQASTISEHSVSKAEVGIYINKEPKRAVSFSIVKSWRRIFIGSSHEDGWDEVVCVDDEGKVYAQARKKIYKEWYLLFNVRKIQDEVDYTDDADEKDND